MIEAGVKIGADSRIGNHVTVESGTTIGENVIIYHGSSIGAPPQDLKYDGESTELKIGDNVVVREYCTINRGTRAHGVTELGAGCLLMAYVHIAHDCIVGENVIFANQATFGGHVQIDDWASLGGGVLVHQFCRIGAHAFIGGGFRVVQDVPPFILAAGEPLRFAGINTIGLKRRGFDSDRLQPIKRAMRQYFRSSDGRTRALAKLKSNGSNTSDVNQLIDFIETSERGII